MAAEANYLQVLRQAVQSAELPQIWLASSNLLSLYSEPGVMSNPALAVFYGKLALNAVLSLDETKVVFPALYKTTPGLFDDKPVQVYHQLGAQLLLLQRYREAEQVMRQFKQRELQELLMDTAASNPMQGLALTPHEIELKAKLGLPSKTSESTKLWTGQSIESRQPRSEFATSSEGLLLGVSGQDDPKAVALHYFVTDQQVSILLVSAAASHTRVVQYSQAQLDRQVNALRLALANRLDVTEQSRALHKVLISPVQDLLTDLKPDTLVLNLSGRLRYLPFAVLQSEQGRFLIEDHALVNATAASGHSLQAAKPIGRIDALGSSLPRLGQVALPGVRDEIKAIIRSPLSPQGLLPGSMALDEEFTQARFNQALQGRHSVVHVATHFKFTPGSARESLLYLGQGEPISLQQISRLDYSRLDLLTLSACDTALAGGADENGSEVEGLSASVLKGGARSVLGSLWQVSDQSTGRLMKAFYAQRSLAQAGNAQALRQAQLALLTDLTGRFRHPFYWGAFVLSGAWR